MEKLYIILLSFFCLQLWGQSNESEINQSKWIANAGYHSALFTGKEQTKYPRSFENHPFFIQEEIIPGSLSYDGVFYPSVSLRWDTYKDELIVISNDQKYNIILVADRLERANFSDIHLAYLNTEKVSGIPRSGYYIELYNGKYNVWEKPEAKRNDKHGVQKVIQYFTFTKKYYIQKGNILLPVKNLSTILKIFPDKKKELKSFSKKNKLNFRANPETAIPTVVKEYERLTLTENL